MPRTRIHKLSSRLLELLFEIRLEICKAFLHIEKSETKCSTCGLDMVLNDSKKPLGLHKPYTYLGWLGWDRT
jgi:hypothetical protein